MSDLEAPCTACGHALARHWEGGCHTCECRRSIPAVIGSRAVAREANDTRPRCACGHAAARHLDMTGPCSLRLGCGCGEFHWPQSDSGDTA